MSASTTRERILDAARDLLERRGAGAAGLADIGRAAGVSRQTVYLHFGSRGALLRELIQHINRRTALAELARPVHAAPDALAELDAFIALQAAHNPSVAVVARALYASRETDAAAGEAWELVRSERRAACRRIARRLAGEGRLATRWAPDTAADVLYALTSTATWDQLCGELGWSNDDYRQHVTAVARASLVRGA